MKDSELLELQLFLGMSLSELSAMKAEGFFAVDTATKGTVFATAGEKADRLTIVTKGRVTCLTRANDGSYSLEERLNAPLVIEPQRLFGLKQRFWATYTATTPCIVVRIGKQDVVRMMERSMVFRINFLNAVTWLAQGHEERLWRQWPEDVPQRVLRFIKDRCQYQAGHKLLRIKMTTLARELGCSRLEVSEALHVLEDREQVRLRREMVEVPMIESITIKS